MNKKASVFWKGRKISWIFIKQGGGLDCPLSLTTARAYKSTSKCLETLNVGLRHSAASMMKSIQVVLVATVIFSAVYAARPKRYYVPRSQPLQRRPNETPDDGEPDLSVYPTPEWMQRIIHPKDYNAGVEGWATQERRCSVATALADDLCDGLHQVRIITHFFPVLG